VANGDKRREVKKRVSFKTRDEALAELKRVLEIGKKTLARSKEVSEHIDRATKPKPRISDSGCAAVI
jgi:hypothetical protein